MLNEIQCDSPVINVIALMADTIIHISIFVT